jgi:hypothetical protein
VRREERERDPLLSPELFLPPCREEVEEVITSGATAIGVPEGMHMLWGEVLHCAALLC